MGFHEHSYIGYAFLGGRALQIPCLIAIIGMVGSFISKDTQAHIDAPSQLVGTLVMSCLAMLWILASFAAAYTNTRSPYCYLTACVLDSAFMIPFIVIAAVLGGPLSVTSCAALPIPSKASGEVFLALPFGSSSGSGSRNYILFAGANQSTCYVLKAAWALIIAMCILFGLGGIAGGLLFLRQRRDAARATAAAAAAAGLGKKKNESDAELAVAEDAAAGTTRPTTAESGGRGGSRCSEDTEDSHHDYDGLAGLHVPPIPRTTTLRSSRHYQSAPAAAAGRNLTAWRPPTRAMAA